MKLDDGPKTCKNGNDLPWDWSGMPTVITELAWWWGYCCCWLWRWCEVNLWCWCERCWKKCSWSKSLSSFSSGWWFCCWCATSLALDRSTGLSRLICFAAWAMESGSERGGGIWRIEDKDPVFMPGWKYCSCSWKKSELSCTSWDLEITLWLVSEVTKLWFPCTE